MIKEILLGLFGLFIFGIISLSVFFSLSYFELKGVIKDCNKDFGVGNWTFGETKDHYSCSAYNLNYHSNISVSTTLIQTRECYIDGNKVNCSELK